jgi:hypothetical protein
MGRRRKTGEITMSAQWYDPMKNSQEGILLTEVQDLLKSVQNKKEGSMKGYKSDRGQKPAPKLPTPKGKKLFGKSTDASDNCPRCGANPHEECGMPGRSGEHQAINCKLNPIAFDSRLDDLREPESMIEHLDENHGKMRSPQKIGGVLLRGEESTVDYLQKYEKEPSSMNSVPQFQNVDGGIPVIARGFTTNQRIPHTEDGIKKKIISEKAKIPAYAQKGYTAKSSSLHMHLTDGGNAGNIPNIAPIEERLASLTKGASRVNQGVIGEIEGIIKQIKAISKSDTCPTCDAPYAKETSAWSKKGMCGTKGCEGNKDHSLFGGDI